MASETQGRDRNSQGGQQREGEEHFQGYDVTFVPDIDKKYSCPVCLVALRDPVQTKCGHRFCKTCLSRVCGTKRYVRCPVDNTWFDCNLDVFDDIAMMREVLSLSVLCHYHSDGCSWKGELRELQEHVPVCPYETLSCPNICGETFLRKEREEHLSECPRRLVNCKYCSENLICSDLTRHELLLCPKFPVSCAQCGQHGVLRENIPRHVDVIDGDCPHTMVPCTFQHIGCQMQIKRCELSVHCQDAASHHISLLSSIVIKQQMQIETTQSEVLDYREKYQTLSTELKILKQKLKERDLLVSCQAEKISVLENTSFNGKLLWKMNLAEKDQFCRLTSPTFYTGCPGYRLCVQAEFNAYNGRDETYTSLFVILKKGVYDDKLKFPFNAVCKVTVYEQGNRAMHRKDFTTSIVCSEVPRPPSTGCNENQKRGRLKFMMTEKLIGEQYAGDGSIYMQIDVSHTLPANVINVN
ncbi:TNF receptor-associated factor 6-like [Ptychodera flava]|uniref:TNF receptor-associated factor 6-like n=1 Tax=Ptychodera flava TaxID=63121 RepID=UPI00396A60C3